MVNAPTKANIELKASAITRLGFINRSHMAERIHTISSLPQAHDVLAAHGILKFKYETIDLGSVEASNVSNIVTLSRWNSALEALGMIPIETDHISVKERVIDRIGNGLLEAKRGIQNVSLRTSSALDRVSETLNPETKKIADIYQQGIRSAEDAEIMGRLAANQSGCGAVGLIGAFALGAVASIGIASALSVTLPVGVAISAIGLTGIFSYAHCPSFRDRMTAILKGAIPLGAAALAMYAGREYLGFKGKEFYTILSGLGALSATQVALGLYDSLVQRNRIRQLAKESAPLALEHRYTFEILENLYKVNDATQKLIDKKTAEAKECLAKLLSDLQSKAMILSADQKKNLADRINKANFAIAANNKDAIKNAIDDICNDLDKIKIPEFHLPNQPLITMSRLARIFNLLFFFTLHPVFFTKTHGPIEALAFSGFYLASAFYTYGAFSYMGTVEQAEKVEPLKYPKLDESDKSNRAKLVMFRYTAPGGFMSENPMESLVQDIFTRIIYKTYKVIFRNAAAWTCKGQTYGFIKTAHVFEGRIKKIKEIIDRIAGFAGLDEEAKNHMAFSLSIEERSWPAHRVLDDAANEAYENAPPEGQVVRFRDSIGRWHGEKAAYRTLEALFDDRLSEVFPDKGSRKKYNGIRSNLKQAIMDQRDITLENLHNREALAASFKRIDENLTADDINELIDKVIQPYLEEYLTKTLRYFAIKAGIDSRRAYLIATKAAKTLGTERRRDPIAKLGKELILGVPMDPQDRDNLRRLLVEEYNVDIHNIDVLLTEIQNGKVQEEAKGMARIYKEDVDLFYRLRDQYEFGRALEAGEDGNISKALLWLAQKDDAELKFDGQKDFKKAFLEFKDWALKMYPDKGGPPSTQGVRKLLKAFSKKINKAPKDFSDLQWAQFIEQIITVERSPNSSMAVILAKKIEYAVSVRGFNGLGGHNANERAAVARSIAEEICVELAPHKMFGKDWMKKVNDIINANPGISLEGAQYIVWRDWKNIIKSDVEAVARGKSLSSSEIEFIWELTEAELDRNRREVDTGTLGMYQISSHETDGILKISGQIVSDFTASGSTIKSCLAEVGRLKDERKRLTGQLSSGIIISENNKGKLSRLIDFLFSGIQSVSETVTDPKKMGVLIDEILKIKSSKALDKNPKLLKKIRDNADFGDLIADALKANPKIFDFGAIVGKDGLKSFFAAIGSGKTKQETLESVINSLKGQIAADIVKEINSLMVKGLGDKKKVGTKGWVKSFEELISTIPHILSGDGSLSINFEGDTYEMDGSRTKKYEKNLAFEGADKILEDLTGIECGIYKEGIKLREWMVAKPEADPMPGERGRLLEKDSLKPFADAVIGIAKTGLTAADLQAELDKIPPQVMIGHMTPLNFMTLNRGRLTGILKDIQKGINDGRISRRNGKDKLDVTHLFSQKVGHLDYTLAKAALTNVALLGATVGEQLGVFLRYCIKHFIEEKGGQTRIPVRIHNLIKENVVRLIRLRADETLDYKEKLNRGMLPDDIARSLVNFIYNGITVNGTVKKLSSRQAAAKVWKEFKLTTEEEETTSAYCEGSHEEIRANLIDISKEIAISAYGSQALGIAAAYHEAKKGRNPDPNNDYTKLLNKHGGATKPLESVIRNYLNSQKNLSSGQRNKIVIMAKDLRRKLRADEKKPENEKLYRCAWHTIPALWTPRNDRDKKEEFLGIKTMRHELIIPRARTMEEIVAWSASQQEMSEYDLDEGRVLEFARMAKKIAKIADSITSPTPSKWINRTSHFTSSDKEELKKLREEFIKTLSIKLESIEKDDQEGVINYLDEGRFERTYFEMEEADFHGNWDLDNITSYRFPFFTAHFGFHHGILAFRGDALLQYGNNYEYQGLGPLARSQQDKDTTLRDNMWLARGQKAPRGIVRNRLQRLRKTAFPIGYANMMPVDTVMECVKTIEAINITMRDKGTYDELFYGKLAKNKIYGELKRASMLIPVLGAVFAAGMGLFSNSVPGFSGWEPAAITAGAGYLLSKTLGTGKTPTMLATYLGVSHFAGALGLPQEWFTGHEFWNIAGWSSVANLSLFNLVPRWGSHLLGRNLKLSEYIHTRILYNVLRIVEDSATGVAMLSKDFQVAGSKGAVQWNDQVVALDVLFGQYDRWFGGNAEYIREFIKDFFRERQALTMSQWSDLMSCYAYPLSSLAADISRYGLLLLTATWITALSFLNPEISDNFIMPHMGWVALLGLIGWKTSMTAFKMSRHHEGAQKSDALEVIKSIYKWDSEKLSYGLGAVSRHLTLENFVQPAIRRGVMVKYISDDRSAFVVTKNPIRPQLPGSAIGDLLRKNWGWWTAFTYLGYKVINNNLLTDFLKYRDFSSLPMGIVSFWLLYEWQKILLGGVILKYGNRPDKWHRKWEKKNSKNMVESLKNKA